MTGQPDRVTLVDESLFDLGALSRWLVGLGAVATGPLRVERIGAGQSNMTCRVTDSAGHRIVIRRPPLGDLAETAHDVEREHAVMTALGSTVVPVPRVLGLASAGAVSDTKVLALEHVDGYVVDGVASVESLTPMQRFCVGESMAETLANLHAVDIERVRLANLASHEPLAPRQLRRWRRQWESMDSTAPLVDDLASRLARNVPEPGLVRLVHGDFHLLNLILDPAVTTIRAVLDWELCTLGDPLADVGTLLAYWVDPDDVVSVGFDGTALPGFPNRDEMARMYCDAAGCDPEGLEFWRVLALWKTTIIATGVLERQRADERNGAPSVGFDERKIAAIASQADRAATERGW